MTSIQETLRDSSEFTRVVKALSQRVTEDEVSLQVLRESLTETKVVVAFLQEALERTRRDEETKLAEIATSALREAFPDQILSLKLQAIRWRNRPGTKVFLSDGSIWRPTMGFWGGGILGVLGVLFRILTVVRHPRLQRVLILDEPLTGVSPEYQEAVSGMLKAVCRDLGFKVLLITQVPGLSRGADRHYRATTTPRGVEFKLEGSHG